MKTPFFRVALCLIMSCLFYITNNQTVAAPFPSTEDICGVIDYKQGNRHYARQLTANLNVGEPRTVRLIHFVSNDGTSKAGVTQKMQTAIRQVQSFYTEQMPRPTVVDQTGRHKKDSFRIETNRDDDPIVHRINGKYPDSYYRDKHYRDIYEAVWKEVSQSFHIGSNVYLVVISNGSSTIGDVKGVGGRSGKIGGMALVSDDFTWDIVAHELGHAFGLQHNFHDSRYIMAYGGGQDRILSSCNARFLSKHPYFDDSISITTGLLPTIKMTSEDTYRASSESVSIRFTANDSDNRIHQVLVFAKTRIPHSASGFLELLECSGGLGRPSFGIRFDYNGKIPSDLDAKLSDSESHRFYVQAIDTDGDVSESSFIISELLASHITMIKSDDSDIRALSFSPNGRQLAVQGDNIHVWNNLQPWDLPALKLIYVVKDLSKYVGGGYVDNRVNFTHHYGNMLWDLPFNLQTPILDKDTSAFFSNDGRMLASISRAAPDVIELWDTTTGEHMRTIEHTHYMNRMLFSPDATILACEGMGIYLWDVVTGEPITTIISSSPAYGFKSLAFSPDGNVLATRAYHGSRNVIQLWNITNGENLLSLSIHDSHESIKNPIVFSPDGATLAIIDVFGLCLWDVGTGNELARIKDIYGEVPVAFSPDGMVIASGHSNGEIQVWNTAKWMHPRPQALVKMSGDNQQGIPNIALPKPLIVEVADQNGEPYPGAEVTFTVTLGAGRLNQRFTSIKARTDFNGQAECSLTLGPHSGINIVQVSMGKRKFATFRAIGIEAPDAINMEGDYRTWGLPDGARIRLGKGGAGRGSKAVTFSPDGQHFAVASQVGIWLYDAATARELALFPTEYIPQSVWFSPDGATLMSTELRAINQWNVETGERIDRSENENLIEAFSPDGKIAASIYNVNRLNTTKEETKIIKLWNMETGEKINTLEGHTSSINSVVFSPDGQITASGANKTVKLWDVATGENTHTLENVGGAAGKDKPYPIDFSSDGRILAAGNTIWDVDTEKNLHTFKNQRVTALAFSSDGETLATAYNTIQLWDVETGENIGTLEGHTMWSINSLSFSPDGNTIASASSADGIVKLWDIKTQMFLDLGHVKYTSSLFSPDSTILVARSNGDVRLWNVETGENIAVFKALSPSAWFSQDGSMLAITSNVVHGSKVLWDIETQTQITNSEVINSVSSPSDEKWTPPNREVRVDRTNQTIELLDKETDDIITTLDNIGEWFYSSYFSPDGNLLAIVSSDGVKLWNISTGQSITILEKNNYLTDVIFSPNGETLAVTEPAVLLFDMEELNSQFTPLAPARVNLTNAPQTELLNNYPNPFNPETWIPFRLAEDADVTLTIYDVGGRMVRTLDIGHSKAGIYESRNKAIYWDGKNDLGEDVASGVYFYHLSAGGYSATRRMAILK